MTIETDRIQEYITQVKKILSHAYSKFVFKKAFFYLIIVFVALSCAFAIPRFMPGDPVQRLIRPNPYNPAQAEAFEEVRQIMLAYFGLNKSLPEQYGEFWFHMVQFDLGQSYQYLGTPVLELVIPRLIFSLVVAIPVLVLSFFIGNWIGGRVAFLKGKSNTFLYYLFMVAQSAPFYWLALIFYVVLVTDLHVFPTYGWHNPQLLPTFTIPFMLDVLRYYALPFSVLFITYTGGWATGMRAMTLYEMDSEYMLYSEQLGFRKRLLRAYAQRNAILPQFTGLNLRLNALIGETLIIEAIFGWPGIGSLSVEAVSAMDFPVLIGCFIVTLIVVIIGNFLIDITYGFIDPRIQTGYGG